MSNGTTRILERIAWGVAAMAGMAVLYVLVWMLQTIYGLEVWRARTENDRWTVTQQAAFAEKIDRRLDPIERDVAVIRSMMENNHKP